jgi:hypothetical protein
VSLLDKAIDGTDDRRFAFVKVGDKLVGRVEDRRTILSEYGEVELLTIRATQAVTDGVDHGRGGVWDLFMGSSYLRRFLEDNEVNVRDYVLLRFEEERPSRNDSPMKVIVGVVKRREAVESW